MHNLLLLGPTAPRYFIDSCLLGVHAEGVGETCAGLPPRVLLHCLVYAGLLLDMVLLPAGLNASSLHVRMFAAASAIAFHLCNHFLFVIETFPFVMIAGTAVFFDSHWIDVLFEVFYRILFSHSIFRRALEVKSRALVFLGRVAPIFACAFLLLHAVVPLRCALRAPWSSDLSFTRWLVLDFVKRLDMMDVLQIFSHAKSLLVI